MNVLLLFTHSFPYTLEEKTFLEPELKYLSQAFDKVIIIPRNVKGDCLLELPENVSVSHHEIYFPYNRLNVLIKNIPLLIRIIFYELYFSKNRLQYIKNGWKMLQHLLLVISNAYRLKKTIEEECDQTDSIVCYSYWFAIWGDILPILKLKSSLIKKVVSRAHGYDVYEFQRKGRFFPFRSFNLSVLDQIYCISENGRNYMASSYSKFSEKIKLSRLGVD